MGANHWPVERCATVFGDIKAFHVAAAATAGERTVRWSRVLTVCSRSKWSASKTPAAEHSRSETAGR